MSEASQNTRHPYTYACDYLRTKPRRSDPWFEGDAMNARTEPSALSLPVRLTSPYEKTIEVEVYGVPMVVTYEYDEGEPPIITNREFSHPGTPANATLLTCHVGGVDITELLTLDQQERIEDEILRALE